MTDVGEDAPRSPPEPTKRNLLGSGSMYALATIAPIVTTLVITPIVTRVLGASEYGIVGISITLYQVGAVVLAIGLPAAITRHAIIFASGARGASALVVIGAIVAILTGATLIALVPAWGHLVLGAPDPWVLAWPLVSSVGIAILTLSQSYLRAVDRVITFVGLSCFSAVLGPLLGIACIAALGPSSSGFLAGLATGQLVAGLIALTIVWRESPPLFSRAEAFESIRIGIPTVPHSVAGSFLVSALVLIASVVSGLEDAGRLQLALLLGTAPTILLGAFNNSWAPMIYRASGEIRAKLLAKSLRLIAVLVFVLVAGFCVLARPVVALVAGPELFTDELLASALTVSAATPLMALYLANMHLVFLSGKTALLAATTPVALVVCLAVIVIASHLAGGASLAIFALGIPLFHLMQWILSGYLRRRSGYPAPRITGALPVLSLAFVSAAVVAALLPSTVVLAAVFGIASIAVVFVNRSSFQS